MAKNIEEAKHTVIIDADLHVQDPHEIILSYFNTSNDNQFSIGSKMQFARRIVMLFAALVLMKFFFQEMFTGPIVFFGVLLIALAVGAVLGFGIPFFVRIFEQSAKNDSLRGIFFQITFITIIVLLIGAFI